MDQGLAVKTHVAALLTFGAQPFVILEGIIDAIDNHLAMGACGQQAQAQTGLHRQTVRAEAAVQFFGQIIGAHHHALQTRVSGNLSGVEHAKAGFHHRPKIGPRHGLGNRIQIGGAVHLGNQDGIHLGAARDCSVHGTGILAAPFGVKPVDPHDPRAVAEIPIREHPRQQFARGGLFLGGHGVFQIEDDRIGRQAHGLFQRPLFRAGDVQDRAIGASGHDSLQ